MSELKCALHHPGQFQPSSTSAIAAAASAIFFSNYLPVLQQPESVSIGPCACVAALSIAARWPLQVLNRSLISLRSRGLSILLSHTIIQASLAIMDERAAIPVTLPCEDPTQSYWQDPPDEIADLRTTEKLPEHADIVIVGSGITGAAVAWNLLNIDSPSNIVMLEARQACSGATGRNGPYFNRSHLAIS